MYNSTILIWDIATGLIVDKFHFQNEITGPIEWSPIDWSPDGMNVAVVNGSSTSKIYTLTTLNLESNQFYIYENKLPARAYTIDWSIANQLMVATNHGVDIWDTETKKLIHKIDKYDEVSSAEFLDDKKIVVTSGSSSRYKSRIVTIADNEGLTEFNGKVIYLDTKEKILYTVQPDYTARASETNTYITKLDYSDIEGEYRSYQYKIIAGYMILPFTIVSLGISILGLYRRFTSYSYLN